MKPQLIFVICLLLSLGCRNSNYEQQALSNFQEYYKLVIARDEGQWEYTVDTVLVYFEKDDPDPSKRYRGQTVSKWGEWDKEMNAMTHYDTLWFSSQENAVKGYFYENNDFYELIGASPNKTLRTYAMDDEGKIKSILFEWQEVENAISDAHMDPIYTWALKHDSLEIMELYPNKEFVPSTKNAKRWRKLLGKYREYQESLTD